MELTDHIADSLSEKERRVDVIERRLQQAASDRQRCLPVHSVAFIDSAEGMVNAQADLKVGETTPIGLFGLYKPWLSATDLGAKVNGASMDASSILDVSSKRYMQKKLFN